MTGLIGKPIETKYNFDQPTIKVKTVQAIRVPNINERSRIPSNAITSVVDQIRQLFKPEKIILFGSYAYGQPRPDSDVDLLVIMDTSQKETEQAIRICQTIHCDYGLDLIVRTPASLARRLALGDLFLQEVMARGKTLYERADR
jgi:predicted nucleotidyltransferase